jgi:hypothetical protein
MSAPRPRRSRFVLAAILALYLLLTAAYGVVNPLFEAPDEHWHYFTAQTIADTRRLPSVPAEGYDEWLSQEAAQPPLYYLLGALLIAPIDTAGAREQVWLNPFASVGDASALTNLNRAVQTPAAAWPWRGYALAAHLLRLFSTLLGLGTLLCMYASGRLLWPAEPSKALLAAALVAFLPQFNFLHAAITNDALIIFLASLALWQLLRLWRGAATTGRLLLLGVTIGLAALTKNAGVLLLLYAAGMLGLRWYRDAPRRPRVLVAHLLLLAAPVAALAGWLWARNWLLYGDPLATEPFIRIAGGDRGYTLWQVLGESRGLWLSLFAVFGWFNLRAPLPVYWVWNGLVALAAAGALYHWLPRGRRHRGARPRLRSLPANLPLLLAGWALLVYAGLVAFMLRTEAAQGRLLFPALVPLALGLAHGLTAAPILRRLAPLWAALTLASSLTCLLFVIRPAYAPPPIVAGLPETAVSLDVAMDQGLTLVGAEVETQTAVPGRPVWLTLYWRAAGPSAQEPPAAPEQVVSIFGRDLREVGKLHAYHGRGLYPATLWPPGALVADRFAVRLEETLAAPVLARIEAGLAQAPLRAAVGAVKVAPPAWPPAAGPALARIGEGIAVTAVEVSPTRARPGETVTLRVQWQATAAPVAALTTLAHLGRPDRPPLAVGDRPPLNGDYPTSVWAAGEVIDDRYTLVIPADLEHGRYPVWLGMYDAATLARLPVTVAGARRPHDVYLAGWVTVGE